MDEGARAHPYMPNSVAGLKAAMLEAVGAKSIEDLFGQLPADHRRNTPLNLPPALASEPELHRHLVQTLSKNRSCETALSFLGGGCWQHHVPAVCDEIVGRAEFLTPVWGTPSSDFGRNQAWFEFASMLGELVGMEMVGLPVYSWGCAAGHAIRMAARLTGRREVLVPAGLDPERRAVIATYCEPSEMASHIRTVEVAFDRESGATDLADLRARLSAGTAAVYVETPNSFGVVEPEVAEIARLARAAGAETIVGVDSISLGLLAPPSDYGADIVVGSLQPLGVHMNCGGGVSGFIASRDEERYAREYPTLLLSITDTLPGGDGLERKERFGFGMTLMHQSSYGSREAGKDWTGNSTYLWAIAAAVYMGLMGPQGFRELGELILRRARYARNALAAIPGVKPRFEGASFKEFVVDFSRTGRSVASINKALLNEDIFGGRDLSQDGMGLDDCALYCVTEVHSRADIDRLADTLRRVLA